MKGDANVAYICSRYYRAPELIFGATEYTNAVDIWSIGCVIGELVANEPLFPGESSVDQIVEIIKILGTPSSLQIKKMNPEYKEYKFPIIKSFTWSQIFKNKKNCPKEFIDLLSGLLNYDPNKRTKPLDALLHPFFDDLREPDTKLPDGTHLPEIIYQFSKEEISQDHKLQINKLIPEWYKNKMNRGNI